MLRRSWLTGIFLLSTCSFASAGSVEDEGLWLAFFGQGDLTETDDGQFRWWFDGQSRLLDDTNGSHQTLLRPGVGYKLGETATIWAGYGWIHTTPVAGDDFEENRIWQQLTWSTSQEPVTFAFRSRLEQRFVETGDDTGWRFRQLLRAQYDLTGCPQLSLVAWDEFFVHLNDTDWGAHTGFDQNRAFAGLGWRPEPDSPWWTEIGYLNQFIRVPGGADRCHHILSLNLFLSL